MTACKSHIVINVNPLTSSQSFKRSLKLILVLIAGLILVSGYDAGAQSPYTSVNNGSWNNDNTWSGTGTPGATDVAIINGHTVNITANEEINQLIIQANGNLIFNNIDIYLDVRNAGGLIRIDNGSSINGGTSNSHIRFMDPYDQQLIVNGTIINLNRLYFTNLNKTVTISGNGQISLKSYMRFYLNDGIRVINNLTGLFTIPGGILFETDACEFLNNGNVTVNASVTSSDDDNVITNNPGASLSILSDINFANRRFVINNYGDFSLSGNFLNIQGIEVQVYNRAGVFAWGGSTYDTDLKLNCNFDPNEFRYVRAGDQPVITPVDNYMDLSLAGTGIKTLRNNITIKNNLSISGSALDVSTSDYSLTVGGDWIQQPTGGFNAREGRVIFAGTTDQSITCPANEEFYNLDINKPIGQVELLNADIRVSNNLNLVSGKIDIGDYDLTLSPAASITGGTTGSYVIAGENGSLVQNIAGTKTFPVGVSSSFLPVTITNSGTSDNFSVNLFPDVTLTGIAGGAQIDEYDQCVKYTWRVIEESPGGSNLSVTLQWNGVSDEGTAFVRTDCSVGYHDGSAWSGDVPSAAAGTGPYTKTRSGLTGGGSFAVGNKCTRIGDHQDPTITCVGDQAKDADAGVCTYTVTGTEFDPTASNDNCSIASVTNDYNNTSTLAGDDFPVGVTTVIWTIEDINGNTNTCSYTVTVTDTQDPTITCVGDQAKNADAGVCTYTVTGTEFDPTAFDDNCSVASVTNDFNSSSTLAGEEFPVGVTTVIWTIEDVNGNTNTCSYTVTVTDTQDPTITCVGDQAKNADAGVCTYTVTGTEFDPTASNDNCSIASVTNDYNNTSTLAGEEFPVGITTVIWTIEDINGNTNTCSYTVTVTDTQDPTITCVGDQAKDADAGVCTYTVTGTEFDPTASNDNCSIASVTNDYNNTSTLAGDDFPVGVTTVIWTIEDINGNTNTCSYTVTVTDTQDPTITCVGDQTKNADAGVCTYTVTGTEFDPTAFDDNCSVASVTNDFNSSSTLAGEEFPVGVTTVIWTIEDVNGNTNTCSYTVTVTDTQDPTITCVGDQAKDADAGECTYTVTGTEFDPTASNDNCSVADITNDFNGLPTLAAAGFPVGETIVVWTVTDVNGNTNTCSYTVTVTDTQDPTITCVGDQAKNADAGVCTYTVTGTEFDPTAFDDNCSVASVTNDYNNTSTLAGDDFPVGETTVIWTIEDINGNTNTCSYTVTVTDAQDPTITCVGDQAKDADAGVCTYTVTGTEFDPTASDDNCSVASVMNDYNNTSTLAGDNFPVGVTTVIWTIEDINGNTNTCSYTVTVTDTQDPTITCVGDQAKNADAGVCTYTVTGTEFDPTAFDDNCSVASVTNDFNSSSTLAGEEFPVGVTTVIWTIEDVNGNTNTCSYTVTVTDTQDPTITCVGDQAKNADAGVCTYTVTGTEFDPTASNDNCSIASVTNDYNNTSTLAGEEFPVGITTVIWTIEDINGNTNTCSYTVTVTDTQDPTITCVGDQAKDADAGVCTYTVTGTEFDPTASNDNCSIASVTNDYNNTSTLAGDDFPVGVTTVIWTIEDINGNTNTCSYTVTVTDTQDPTITCVGDQAKNADAGVCTYTVTGTEFDPTASNDNCSIASVTNDYNNTSTLAGEEFPVGVTTVIWTIEDVNGNTNTCSYTVTITDTQDPTITCVGDQAKDADAGVCTYTVTGTEFDPTASNDNCSIASVTNDYNNTSTLAGEEFPVGITTVIWTIEDINGNTNTCSYTVTVTDTQDPTITCVGDQAKNANAGVCTYTVTGTEFDPTASDDNCSVASVTNDYNNTSTLAGEEFPVGVTTVIWTIEDINGRKNTCSYTVTVTDTQDPTITCVGDQTKNADAGVGYYTIIGTEFDPTGSYDNCGVADITNDFNGLSTLAGEEFPVGETIVIWTVEDVNGLTGTCSFTIKVTDTQDPTITCVGDQAKDADAGECTYTVKDTEFDPTDVDDNDGVASVTNNYNNTATLAGEVFPSGETTVTWTVEDINGRTSTCNFTVTVTDNQDPTITCVGDQAKDADAGVCTYTVTGTEFDPTASNDNCSIASVTNDYNNTSTLAGDDFPVGVTTVIWTIEDINGNTNTCSYTVTVTDTQDPTITCVGDQTKNADAGVCTYTVTGTEFDPTAFDDNCSVASVTNDFNSSSTLAGEEFPVGVTTVIWTIEDVNGNTNTCSYTVTVTDTQDPTITCVGDQAKDADAGECTYTVTGTEFDPTASNDNCSVADITNDFNGLPTLAAAGFPVGETIVVWTVTDVNGNTGTCSFKVTISDVQDPDFNVPVEITVCRDSECLYDIDPSVTGEVTVKTDNCTPSDLLTVESSDGDLSGISDCDVAGFFIRTWKVTDAAGNSTEKQQIIWVEPTPTASITINTPVICDSTAVNISFDSPTISKNQEDLVYEIDVTSTDQSHLGGTASSDFTLSKDQLPFTLNGTLINTSDTPIEVNYTINATITGCSEWVPVSGTVIINPTPRIFPVPLNSTQCDSTYTDIELQSPSIFTDGAVSFKYTAVASGNAGDITGFTATDGGLANGYTISQQLINHTDEPQTVSYTITPVSGVVCNDGPSRTVVVTVNPTPRIFPVPLNSTQCDSTYTDIELQSPSIFTDGAVSFKYTAVASGNAGDITGFTASDGGLANGYTISQQLINHTDEPQTVSYTITPVSGVVCNDGPSRTVVVTVNPTPRIFPVPLNSTQCDSTYTDIELQSPSIFTDGAVSFKYTAVASGNAGDITGFTATDGGLANGYTISQQLINHTDEPQTVSYTITPVSGVVCNDGPSRTVVVTVNPTPRIFPVPLNSTQCDSTYTDIELQSPSIFTDGAVSFKYTAVASGNAGDITGFTATDGGLANGYTISQQLINHTDEPQTVSYTITPVSGVVCNDGPSRTVVVTVNPTPRIFPVPLNSTQCDSTYTDIELQSPSIFTDGAVSFKYTAVASGNAGDITGFTASDGGLANGYTISQQLINHTDEPQTVSYTITPVSGVVCNDGPSRTVVVTVNPTPRIFPVPLNSTQCDSTYTDIELQSPSIFTDGAVSFKYTAVASGNAGDITGFTATDGGLANGYTISQQLINHTDEPQTVSYTITPVSGVVCNDGPSRTVVVTVNPTPRIFPVPLNSTQCDSTYTDIELQSPSIFTDGAVSFKYTAVASGNAGDITGFTATDGGLANGYTISQQLINHTDEPQTVSYTITPVSGVVCNDGPSRTVVVTVNPTPRIFPVPLNSTQCDSTYTDIELQSPSIFTDGAVSFKYTAVASGNAGDVTGFTATDGGLANGYTISQQLINHTDEPQTVSYTITPVSGVVCNDGPSRTVVVTINPTPRALPVNLKPEICYGDLTEIILESPTVMTSGEILFDYSIIKTGTPGSITGNENDGYDREEGDVLSFQYRNYYDSVLSVRFAIIPKVNGPACNPGVVNIQEVKVHPKPARGILITRPFTCKTSVSERGALRAVVSRGADPLEIVWEGPVEYIMEDSLDITNLDWGRYTLKVTDNIGCYKDTSIQILPNLPVTRIFATPLIPNVHISCPGASDGTIDIYVTSGSTAPYSFRFVKNDTITIDTGIFTGNYDPLNPDTFRRYYKMLGAGVYKLIIKDNNECEVIKTTELREPDPIAAEFEKSNYNGYNVTCKNYNNGFIRINSISGGSGSYQYQWSAEAGPLIVSSTESLLDSVPAGVYYLTTTDPVLNCEVTDTLTLTEPEGMNLPDYEISITEDGDYNISCSGASDGSISLTIAGGSGMYNYSWTGPDGFTADEEDISGLQAGNYVVTVTDLNGCMLILPDTYERPEFNLTEPDPLDLIYSLSESVDGSYNINCNGGTGTVDITVTGGSVGNYFYDWSTADGSGISQGDEDQFNLTAGTYSLTVSDLNGCETTRIITLEEPPVIEPLFVPVHITCMSSGFTDGSIDLTVTGGIAPYTFSWSNGADTEDISGLAEGYYSVAITDANGCGIIDSVRIDNPPSLTYDVVLSEYNGFNISCNGLSDGSIQINMTSGTSPYQYTWLMPDGSAETTPGLSGLQAGEYVLHIVDQNSCTGDTTIVLTEPGKLGMNVTLSESNAGGYNINCAGSNTGTITLEAINNAGPVEYLWADGEIGSSRTGLFAGNYRVVITDSNNCREDSTILLTEPDSMSLVMVIIRPTCFDMSDGQIITNVTGGVPVWGYNYLWSDGSTGNSIGNIAGGFFSVSVRDRNGCVLKDSVNIEPVNELCLKIPNAISPNGDIINDTWEIGLTELYPQLEVKIFDRWGMLIWKSEKGYPKPWDGTNNGKVLPIDSYHYLIDLNNGTKPVIGTITIIK